MNQNTLIHIYPLKNISHRHCDHFEKRMPGCRWYFSGNILFLCISICMCADCVRRLIFEQWIFSSVDHDHINIICSMDFPPNSTSCSNHTSPVSFFSRSLTHSDCSFSVFIWIEKISTVECDNNSNNNKKKHFVEKLIKIGLNVLETNCDRN